MRDIEKLTAEYLRAAASRWVCLESGGVEFPLSEVYCMLQAVETPPPKPLEPRPELAQVPARLEHTHLEIAEKLKPPKPVAVGEALKDANRLALLGEPGAGKSTTLQFIGLCFASPSMAADRLGLDEACIPVRLGLRDFAVGFSSLEPGIMLESALAGEVNTLLRLQDVKLAKTLVHTWRNKGRLLVLLDGLDEVPERNRTAVRKEIQDFVTSSAGQKCRVVVSSRLAGFTGLGGNFKEYTLKPFESRAEARPYLAAWLRALKGEWAGQADEKAGALLEQLEGQPALKRLTDNPLILRLAAEVYAAGEAVPESRADLYGRYLDTAWQRAVERGALDKEKTFEALETLAWQLQMGEPPTVEDAILNTCREKMGLVVSVDERLVFSHTTFQEYFVALRLKRAWEDNWKWTWQFLRPRLHSALWQEPLLLLAGMLDVSGHQRLVNIVLNARSPYERSLRRDLRLAAEIIAERKGVAEDSVKAVIQQASSILKPWHFGINKRIEKYMAIKALWELGGPQVVEPLIQALKDDEEDVRWTAAEALGKVGGPQAVEPLIQALKDEHLHVRWSAEEALEKLGGPQVVEPLIQVLKDHDEKDVRRAAAHILGRLGGPQVIEPLIQALKDNDSPVRWVALIALKMMDGQQVLEPLIQALKDNDEDVRRAAAEILGEKGGPQVLESLIEVLKDDDNWYVRQIAARALEKLGEPQAVEPLIRALKDHDKRVYGAAAKALVKLIGPKAFEPLIQALKDNEGNVRESVVQALGELGDPRLLDLLIQVLKDKDEGVRRAAAEALEKLGKPQAVEPLIQALKDNDRKVRDAAVYALGNLGGPQVLEPLIQALKDNDEAVRMAVVYTMGKLGGPQVLEPLILALKDDDWNVRQGAVGALGEMGGPQVLEPLIQAMKDPVEDVRWVAVEALGNLGGPQVLEPLIQAMKDGWEKPHNAVIYALMKMDEHQLLESMIKALNDSDTNVRWTAAEILGKLGEPQAVEPLIQALKDDHWLVRQAAAHSLEKMSGPQVLEPMIRALKGNDKNLHLIAIKALEKLGGIQLIEPMIQAIKYKNKVVGHAALEVLEMILPGMEVKSSYRDPLEEPPGEMVKRRWVRVSRILALFLLLSMAAVGAVLLGAAGDVLKEIWKQDIQNFAKSHPIWSVILIIAGLGAVLGLVDWLKKHVEE